MIQNRRGSNARINGLNVGRCTVFFFSSIGDVRIVSSSQSGEMLGLCSSSHSQPDFAGLNIFNLMHGPL